MEFALRGEISERQAKEILSRRASGISGDTLANLIASDAGFAFLSAMLGMLPVGEAPEWWTRVKRQMALSDLRRAHEEQKKTIERLEAEAGGGA